MRHASTILFSVCPYIRPQSADMYSPLPCFGLSVCLSVSLSVSQWTHSAIVCLSIRGLVCVFVRVFVCLRVCLFMIGLYVCTFVYLYVCECMCLSVLLVCLSYVLFCLFTCFGLFCRFFVLTGHP